MFFKTACNQPNFKQKELHKKEIQLKVLYFFSHVKLSVEYFPDELECNSVRVREHCEHVPPPGHHLHRKDAQRVAIDNSVRVGEHCEHVPPPGHHLQKRCSACRIK